MAENISNLGYLALAKETTVGVVPSTPSVYVPIFDETIKFDTGLTQDTSAVGSKAKVYQVLPGRRSFMGDVTVVAEPNTASHFINMLLTQGSPTGSGPYTHPFTLSATNPASYTMDIAKGPIVERYWGVQCENLGHSYKDNEMQLKAKVSALGSFVQRTITSISTTTLVLDSSYSDYSSSPTTGLVVGDLIQISSSTNPALAPLQTTVASITNGTTVVLAASAASFAAGDQLFIRAGSPNLNTVTPFLWARTQFCFGATAAAALSATHTPLESSSTWTIAHDFNDAKGEWRSGSFNPASLARKTVSYAFKIKQYFDAPNSNLISLHKTQKVACVIRHYSESGYELRVTLNNFKLKGVVPAFKVGDILYSEMEAEGQYDQTDGQLMDIKVINNLATV